MKTKVKYNELKKSKIYEEYDDYIINVERRIRLLEEEREEINRELKGARLEFKRFWEHVKREQKKNINQNETI